MKKGVFLFQEEEEEVETLKKNKKGSNIIICDICRRGAVVKGDICIVHFGERERVSNEKYFHLLYLPFLRWCQILNL